MKLKDIYDMFFVEFFSFNVYNWNIRSTFISFYVDRHSFQKPEKV